MASCLADGRLLPLCLAAARSEVKALKEAYRGLYDTWDFNDDDRLGADEFDERVGFWDWA